MLRLHCLEGFYHSNHTPESFLWFYPFWWVYWQHHLEKVTILQESSRVWLMWDTEQLNYSLFFPRNDPTNSFLGEQSHQSMPQSPHGALRLQFSPCILCSPFLCCQITLKGWSMFLSGSSPPLLHPPGSGRGQGILAHSHWNSPAHSAFSLPSPAPPQSDHYKD